MTPKHEHVGTLNPLPLIRPVALGNKIGTTSLNIWQEDPLSDTSASLLGHVAGNPLQNIAVKMETIDLIAEETGYVPDLIKLDLQGYELSALQGSQKSLAAISFVFVEFGCLDAYIGRTTPLDLLQYLAVHDFVLYDIVDPLYRPYDGALAGGDFFFVKKEGILRHYKAYR